MKRTKVLAECAVAVALAVLCSFIKVWEMPQGGSVSLTMVPLLFIAFRRGGAAGIMAGAVYEAVSLMFVGVIFHPMSILLDYILAYAVLGVAGFFGRSMKGVMAGTFVGTALRFISSLISGAVLFASYAPAGQNPWVYSFVYQITYMFPELVICIVVFLVLKLKAARLFLVNE